MEIKHGSFQLLPPAPHLCQCCAVNHPPEQPHDATSLHYGFWFVQYYGRSPTWNDALAHCSEEIQTLWISYLLKVGVDPASTQVRGDLKSQADLEARLGIDLKSLEDTPHD